MPFKSEAQRRKFYAMADRGEISRETVEKWEDETPKGKKLPKRVKKKASLEAIFAKHALLLKLSQELGDVSSRGEMFGPVARATYQTFYGRDSYRPKISPKTESAYVEALKRTAGSVKTPVSYGFAELIPGVLGTIKGGPRRGRFNVIIDPDVPIEKRYPVGIHETTHARQIEALKGRIGDEYTLEGEASLRTEEAVARVLGLGPYAQAADKGPNPRAQKMLANYMRSGFGGGKPYKGISVEDLEDVPEARQWARGVLGKSPDLEYYEGEELKRMRKEVKKWEKDKPPPTKGRLPKPPKADKPPEPKTAPQPPKADKPPEPKTAPRPKGGMRVVVQKGPKTTKLMPVEKPLPKSERVPSPVLRGEMGPPPIRPASLRDLLVAPGRAAGYSLAGSHGPAPTLYSALTAPGRAIGSWLGSRATHTGPAAKKASLPQAVIIKGNPTNLFTGKGKNPDQGPFYRSLAKFVKSHGYRVSFDAGKPHTSPKPADVWIGHSRGVDRLRFAPKGTKTIALGTTDRGSVTHPVDRTRTRYVQALLRKSHPDVPLPKIPMKDRVRAQNAAAKKYPFEGDPHHLLTDKMKAQLSRRLGKVATVRKAAKAPVSASDIHRKADRLGIPWDSTKPGAKTFLRLSRKVTGKTHIDDMTPGERQALHDALSKKASLKDVAERYPVSTTPIPKSVAKKLYEGFYREPIFHGAKLSPKDKKKLRQELKEILDSLPRVTATRLSGPASLLIGGMAQGYESLDVKDRGIEERLQHHIHLPPENSILDPEAVGIHEAVHSRQIQALEDQGTPPVEILERFFDDHKAREAEARIREHEALRRAMGPRRYLKLVGPGARGRYYRFLAEEMKRPDYKPRSVEELAQDPEFVERLMAVKDPWFRGVTRGFGELKELGSGAWRLMKGGSHPDTLYHGTSPETREKVLREGLRREHAGKSQGTLQAARKLLPEGDPRISKEEENIAKRIFLTRSRLRAKTYAGMVDPRFHDKVLSAEDKKALAGLLQAFRAYWHFARTAVKSKPLAVDTRGMDVKKDPWGIKGDYYVEVDVPASKVKSAESPSLGDRVFKIPGQFWASTLGLGSGETHVGPLAGIPSSLVRPPAPKPKLTLPTSVVTAKAIEHAGKLRNITPGPSLSDRVFKMPGQFWASTLGLGSGETHVGPLAGIPSSLVRPPAPKPKLTLPTSVVTAKAIEHAGKLRNITPGYVHGGVAKAKISPAQREKTVRSQLKNLSSKYDQQAKFHRQSLDRYQGLPEGSTARTQAKADVMSRGAAMQRTSRAIRQARKDAPTEGAGDAAIRAATKRSKYTEEQMRTREKKIASIFSKLVHKEPLLSRLGSKAMGVLRAATTFPEKHPLLTLGAVGGAALGLEGQRALKREQGVAEYREAKGLGEWGPGDVELDLREKGVLSPENVERYSRLPEIDPEDATWSGTRSRLGAAWEVVDASRADEKQKQYWRAALEAARYSDIAGEDGTYRALTGWVIDSASKDDAKASKAIMDRWHKKWKEKKSSLEEAFAKIALRIPQLQNLPVGSVKHNLFRTMKGLRDESRLLRGFQSKFRPEHHAIPDVQNMLRQRSAEITKRRQTIRKTRKKVSRVYRNQSRRKTRTLGVTEQAHLTTGGDMTVQASAKHAERGGRIIGGGSRVHEPGRGKRIGGGSFVDEPNRITSHSDPMADERKRRKQLHNYMAKNSHLFQEAFRLTLQNLQ